MAAAPAEPLVSVVIPNWNGAHLLGPCLDSLRRQRYRRGEVIVVDGASRDRSVELVERDFPEVRLLRLPSNLGFAGNVNAGLRLAQGELLALLNNDAEADPDWLAALVAGMSADQRLGAGASRILHAADRATIASAGDQLCRSGLARQRGNGQPDGPPFDRPAEVFSASGGAAIYRRAMLEDVGLFDELLFMYLEDVDLGLRARLRGWGCRYLPAASVAHRVSATGGGPLASYYVARNTLLLVARGFPGGALRACWPEILRGQLRRAAAASRAWRGVEARATLRGMAAGLGALPSARAARRLIQARRCIGDADFLALLEPC